MRDGKKRAFTDTDRRFHQVGAEPHIRKQIVTQSPRIGLTIHCKKMLVTAQCKALPLAIKAPSCTLQKNKCHSMAYRGPVQTEYLFASLVCLTTELILDMASIAMMPLMARFVWLLTVKPSAEDLRHRTLSIMGSLSTHINNSLIMNVQR